MKFLTLLLFMVAMNSFAVDKQRHIDMSNYLNSMLIKLESTTPDKALVYITDKSNVDSIDTAIVDIDSYDVSDGQLIITRPVQSDLAHANENPAYVTLNPNITKCQADYGVVDIEPTRLIVKTSVLPVRVVCQNASGTYIESYKTFKQN